MDRTDFELIQAFRSGDGQAMDELIRRHLGRVRNMLFQMVLDHDAADDLAQEVFTRVFRRMESFRSEATFVTWVHRIALNVAYDHLRQSDRRHDNEIAVDSIDVGAKAPDSRLVAVETQDRVGQALGRLAPPLRAAIVLTVMQGLTAAEAAALEECPIGTMYWRIHEARQQLREELRDCVE